MLDLAEIRRTWLVTCGPCDYGIMGSGCVCPPGDIRSVVQTLVDELEKLYNNASLLSASTLDEALEEKAWNAGFEAAGERLVDTQKRLTMLEKLCAEAAYDELLSRDWMGRWRQYKALPMAGGLEGDKTALRCLCTWSQHQEGLSSVYTLEVVNRRCPAHGDKPRLVKDEEVSEGILEKVNPADLESMRMIGSMKAGPELFAPWEEDQPRHTDPGEGSCPHPYCLNMHGHTPHGHPCCEKCPVGDGAQPVARCGGPRLCIKCQAARDEIHGTPA